MVPTWSDRTRVGSGSHPGLPASASGGGAFARKKKTDVASRRTHSPVEKDKGQASAVSRPSRETCHDVGPGRLESIGHVGLVLLELGLGPFRSVLGLLGGTGLRHMLACVGGGLCLRGVVGPLNARR